MMRNSSLGKWIFREKIILVREEARKTFYISIFAHERKKNEFLRINLHKKWEKKVQVQITLGYFFALLFNRSRHFLTPFSTL